MNPLSSRSALVSAALVVGLLLLFAGERLFAVGTARAVLSMAGAVLVAGALVVRAIRVRSAGRVEGDGGRVQVERLLLGLGAVIALALMLYVTQVEVLSPKARAWPRLVPVLSALWPALLTAGLLPTVLAELAYAAMHRAPKAEAGRVRDAALSGAGLAAVLVFGFSAYYVANARDVKWDLSFFRTTRPGEGTVNLVRALDEPIEVTAFFPPGNEVREEVVGYLRELAGHSQQLRVSVLDHALEPTRARELGVTGNGTVVLARGERRELYGIGLELQRARSQLRSMDGEVHKRLSTLSRPRRTLYFTTGHGERTAERQGSTDQRWTVRTLRDLFARQNHEVKALGLGEGLGTDVPADAAAVLVVGAQEPMLPEVEASLLRYLDRGGSVLLAIEPEAGRDHAALLAPFGLRADGRLLANDQVFLSRTGAAAHRVNLLTHTFSSHPSVTTLGRLGQRATVAMFGATALQAMDARPENVKVDFTVRAHGATFRDGDGDFTQREGEGEERRAWALAAAVTRANTDGTEARLLVLGDSDVFGDPIMESVGNAYLALDGLRWLLGEEALVGETISEEDVRVQHTREQDVAWFYSTVFLVPGLVLGAGFWFSRGGRRKARRADGGGKEAAR